MSTTAPASNHAWNFFRTGGLDQVALPPGADPVSYPLAEVPVTSTIEVTVEGAPFTLWSYDRARNAVVFDGDAVPALGAEVAIEYVLAVACG